MNKTFISALTILAIIASQGLRAADQPPSSALIAGTVGENPEPVEESTFEGKEVSKNPPDSAKAAKRRQIQNIALAVGAVIVAIVTLVFVAKHNNHKHHKHDRHNH